MTVLVAAGGAVLEDTRTDAERSGMQNSMAAFSSKASLVGLGESGAQEFSLGRTSAGDVRVDPEAGSVTLWLNRTGDADREKINSTDLGAVVYESGDTEIAYQGGGVWERRGGASRMVSPPEYHYRLNTLTFPIMTVRGGGQASGSVEGRVSRGPAGRSEAWFPNPDADDNFTNPLDQGTVLVEVESRYCEGWEGFFTERSQGAIKESCGDNGTVVVDLTVPFQLSADEPVVAKEIIPSGNGEGNGSNDRDVPDSWTDGVVAPSISPEVEDRIDECESGGCDSSMGDDTVTAGTYDLTDGGDVDAGTFDTGDGNITLVVDGDLELNEIDIEGDGTVSIYIRGELTVDSAVNDGGNASQLMAFVHSSGSVRFDGESDYTGVIYAPKSDLTMNGSPAIDYTGALVVETFDLNGNLDKLDFRSDPSLDGYQLVGGDRPLTYLHVSENRIDVGFD